MLTATGTALAPTAAMREDPIRATQHLFRVTMDALANPGTVRQAILHPLFVEIETPYNPWLASLAMTLLDHEVSLATVGTEAEALGEMLARRTRVAIAPPETAAFVFITRGADLATLPETLQRGSFDYPDDGATLVVEVPSLAAADATATLRLTGPGIAGEGEAPVTGIDAAFVASRQRAVAAYPTGIDCLLVDAAGRLLGLPRTTSVTWEAR